ncbi:C6 zinc finger domain-containing protein [Aspergillus eucalypticola CBS 122712]|uniref:C6 zinc finger domain-containing protein n=1 Tax=Aspergillus eucalypticola (strain CBS 122712 / IBT 29274) TaxID=1448314 RepID=A0A317VAQ9_ASPEC|nr:C6 zinc finger domain-containing protein [Aspergillus eucalypticola CBS 122712]PWY71296.1 C6 zinc finger domain-containing protein [Aspergillus eucalypticola CBS 122712]
MLSTPPSGPPGPNRPKLACSLCARRKVKCDKGEPCSNCLKAHAQCIYEAPASPRPRKRAADEELLARLARYEELMRSHNIDFSSHTHTWIPSNQKCQPKESHSAGSRAEKINEASVQEPSLLTDGTTAERQRCLWSDLRPELKHPPIQSLGHKDDPALYPTPSLGEAISDTQSIHDFHPEPKHIYRLWQIFVERVHPMTKIVHVPTLQQRVLDTSCNSYCASKPLTAILFAIYTISITSSSPGECETYFGLQKAVLLRQYRTATLRALIAADFLTTSDLEVLQALVLFLFSNPRCDLTTTLSGAALRLAEKMGLHQDTSDPNITFFEKEMRIRLWWQLRGLEARCRITSTPGMKPPPSSEIGDVRLPLNVNDVDLHPDMTEPPLEHDGPTEMMCVLLKMEVSNWRRRSPTATQLIESVMQGSVKSKEIIELESKAVDELNNIYCWRNTRNSDPHIPLHSLTQAMANLSIARFRFKIHHPRRRFGAAGNEIYITRDEHDILFESALTWVQSMMDIRIRSKFPYYLFTHFTTDTYMDAYIHILLELRQRRSRDRVALAWQLVEDLFSEHPELIDDSNPFFVSFTDLVLDAWDSRSYGLDKSHGALEAITTPRFIQQLFDKKRHNRLGDLISSLNSQNPGGFELQDEEDTSWLSWGDFLQL